MKNSFNLSGALLALLVGGVGAAAAQTTVGAAPAKTIAVEADAPFAVFNRWTSVAFVAPAEAPTAPQPIRFAAPNSPAGAPYQPMPVIMGLPDWPLLGDGVARAAQQWGSKLNYQGVQMRLVVIDPRTGRHQSRAIATGLNKGESFKLQLVTSFDAVADIDQIVGEGWNLTRTARAYPAPDSSVQIKSGRTLELPVGAGEYFSLDGTPANQRIVVSVRHDKAVNNARSLQPTYRQDGRTGSSFLQLVPGGQFPAIEQLITSKR